ncbi:MAG: sodium:proton antiporter, partial [Bacteroidetes bacterium]
MTATIIIALCLLLLVAYVFDVSASKTKVPAVILLLISGWAVKQLATWWGISLPNLSAVLPILGTIGLILIVLEGALELEFNASKTGILLQSTVVALVPILALSAG